MILKYTGGRWSFWFPNEEYWMAYNETSKLDWFFDVNPYLSLGLAIRPRVGHDFILRWKNTGLDYNPVHFLFSRVNPPISQMSHYLPYRQIHQEWWRKYHYLLSHIDVHQVRSPSEFLSWHTRPSSTSPSSIGYTSKESPFWHYLETHASHNN